MKRGQWVKGAGKAAAAGTALVGMVGLGVGGLAATAGAAKTGDSVTKIAGLKLSKPISLGFLWEIQGESEIATSQYQQGATMAVNEINAGGGVGGQKVTWFRQTLPPLTLQKTVSDFVQAAGQHPTAMIGVASPTQATTLAADITNAKTPVFITDVGGPTDIWGGKGSSAYSWFLGNDTTELVTAALTYDVKTLHLKKIGLFGGNDAYGSNGVKKATAVLKANGLTPYAVEQFAETSTTLTSEVLAMKGAQGVFNWAYPTPVGAQLKQMAQAGINIPTVTDESGSLVASAKLAPATALTKMSVSGPCNTENPTYSPNLATFTKAFEKKYGTAPTPNATWGYDGVYFAVDSVVAAKSTTPVKVNNAVPKVSLTGTCGTYHADGAHILNHTAVIETFSTVTKPVTSKVMKLKPVGKE